MTEQTTNEIGVVQADAELSSNEMVIGRLLAESPFDGLTAVFILEAIRFYAVTVMTKGKPTEHGTGLFSEIAWYEIADSLHTKLKTEFEGSK